MIIFKQEILNDIKNLETIISDIEKSIESSSCLNIESDSIFQNDYKNKIKDLRRYFQDFLNTRKMVLDYINTNFDRYMIDIESNMFIPTNQYSHDPRLEKEWFYKNPTTLYFVKFMAMRYFIYTYDPITNKFVGIGYTISRDDIRSIEA